MPAVNTKRVVRLHEDAALIEALGGSASVARILGYSQPHGTRRVNNWKHPDRGIPEVIRLRRQDVFGPAPSTDASEAANG